MAGDGTTPSSSQVPGESQAIGDATMSDIASPRAELSALADRFAAAGAASTSGPRSNSASVPSEDNEVAASHAVSRAFWTAQERSSGVPDPDVPLARSAPEPDMEPWRRALVGTRHDGVEVFSGILRLTRAGEPFNLHSVAAIERDEAELEFATSRRRETIVTSSDVLLAEYRLWRFSSVVLYTLACAPCRIVATPGRQLGLEDPDAGVTVQAAADVADALNTPWVVQENHANIATLHGGAVLVAIDKAHARGGRERTPLVDGSPHGVEAVCDPGVPELRHRVALMHEHTRLRALISPCPRLVIRVRVPLVIEDILEPSCDVPESLYVAGSLRVLRPPAVFSRTAPTVAAVLTFGGPSVAIKIGSRVVRRGDESGQLYVVTRLLSGGRCSLFADEGPRRYETVLDVALRDLTHVAHDINVHHVRGVAGTVTDMAVAPLYQDKQLILVDGRARRFTVTEVYRLSGDESGLHELRRHVPYLTESQLRSKHGKSLSRPLASAMMGRLRRRIDEFVAVQSCHLLPFPERPEVQLSAKAVAVGAAALVVIFLVPTRSGVLALVDPVSHLVPGIARQTRDDATTQT